MKAFHAFYARWHGVIAATFLRSHAVVDWSGLGDTFHCMNCTSVNCVC